MKKLFFFSLLFLFGLTLAAHIEADDTVTNCSFRDYDNAKPHVKAFYEEQHEYQTFAFATKKLAEYAELNKDCRGVWETLELIEQLVDESDPDLELGQIMHALQTSEAMRADSMPDWFILTGLIHDLGKILTTFGEPQWAVVGDTYPLGIPYSQTIVHRDLGFDKNQDSLNTAFQKPLGIYHEGIGLDNVTMSFGHDEYLYRVVKKFSTLPTEALFVIRFHSFYPLHKHGAYFELLGDADRNMLPWLKTFNNYDLYTKDNNKVYHVQGLKSYYQGLIAKYFPQTPCWK